MPCTGVEPRLYVYITRRVMTKEEYCDIKSLYPYICKYGKFPVVHPVVHVGDTYKDVEACLNMEGLMKCTIVPPEKLYHPVLPFRYNKKLLFCLCRTCVSEQNTSG
jgi:hypothetical protein